MKSIQLCKIRVKKAVQSHNVLGLVYPTEVASCSLFCPLSEQGIFPTSEQPGYNLCKTSSFVILNAVREKGIFGPNLKMGNLRLNSLAEVTQVVGNRGRTPIQVL